MKYLFNYWDTISRELTHKKLMLFLDYDGTITPIVATPGKAILSSITKKYLRKLVKVPNCHLAIISGRELKDLKNKVKINGIIYSGNHGLEIDYRGVDLKFFYDRKYLERLKIIENIISDELDSIRGILIESKGISLSIHYRLIDPGKISSVKKIFYKVVNPYLNKKQISVKKGKMVLEIKPPLRWNKGTLVQWLIENINEHKGSKVIFYFGDDLTDEDAFRALKRKGYTVFVGRPRKSLAKYYVRNTQEVTKVLERFAEIL